MERFGAGFARHFFFPYNRKLYCTDPAELTTEWVGRYVPKPDLADVVDGALGLFPASRAVGYNSTFLYPARGGIARARRGAGDRPRRPASRLRGARARPRRADARARVGRAAVVGHADRDRGAFRRRGAVASRCRRRCARRRRNCARSRDQPELRRARPGGAAGALALRARGALPVLPGRLPSNHGRVAPEGVATPSRSRSACRPARRRQPTSRRAAWRGWSSSARCATRATCWCARRRGSTRPTSSSTGCGRRRWRRCATTCARPACCSSGGGRSGSTRRWKTPCGTGRRQHGGRAVTRLRVLHAITMLELGGAQRNTLDTCRLLDRGRFAVGLTCADRGELLAEAERLADVELFALGRLRREVRPATTCARSASCAGSSARFAPTSSTPTRRRRACSAGWRRASSACR